MRLSLIKLLKDAIANISNLHRRLKYKCKARVEKRDTATTVAFPSSNITYAITMQRLSRTLTCLLLTIVIVLGVVAPALAQFPSTRILTPMVLFSFLGSRPSNLGVKDGKLLPCPSSPNCVSSQSIDGEHKVEPIRFSATPDRAMAALRSTIQGLKRTKIVTESEDYLYVEFSSALMGFVDDVEFHLDREKKQIEVRSASRMGESDLGVNRKRVETIRSQFPA